MPLQPDYVTQCLRRLEEGDRSAIDDLLPHVYGDLRALADRAFKGQRIGHTLQPTALVNEAYVRLLGSGSRSLEGRKHFMNLAARAMRQLLTDHARKNLAVRRGGDRGRVVLDESSFLDEETDSIDLIALDDALRELEGIHARQARIVELRFLAGLNDVEIGEIVGISDRAVRTDWRIARAWLRRKLEVREDEERSGDDQE